MHKENIPTVRRVVDDLHGMERKIDDAIRDCAAFIVTMVDASREMQLSSTVGTAAYNGAAETLTQLTSSRSAAVGLHAELATVHSELRVNRVRAHGDLWKIGEPKRGLASEVADDGPSIVAVKAAA